MKYLVLLFVILCIVVIAEWIREIHTFRTVHYQIKSKKLHGLKNGKKVVLLSDLHSYCYGKNNEKLLSAIKKETPDMILVAGDMLVAHTDDPVWIAEEFMAELPKICDVYYANGNHEHKVKDDLELFPNVYEKYKRRVEDAGVYYLENDRVKLMWDDIPVEIVGLEIPREKYTKFQRNYYELSEMQEQVGKSCESFYEILIAHNPTFMKTYLEWGADLIVSGHLHGGAVRLPFIGGVITPHFSLFPKYSGEMTKVNDTSVIVSKGLGVHTIKIRLFNPAEVVVLHIDGMEE